MSKKKPELHSIEFSAPNRKNLIHPAVHFSDDRAYFGFTITVTKMDYEGNIEVADTPAIISDRGEIIPCIPEYLDESGISLMTEPEWKDSTSNRISLELLTEIMNHGFEKSLEGLSVKQTFEETRDLIKSLIYYEDDRWYDYLTLWIIGTYCFPIFSVYPYLNIWGSKGSSKSRLMELISYLAFNAELTPNISPASLFRSIEANRPTLLLDEMEKIGDKEVYQDLRSMLLSGYKEGGKTKRCMVGTKGQITNVDFDVFSPKAIANIAGMDDVLLDRGVQLTTTKLAGSKLSVEFKKITGAVVNTPKRQIIYQSLRDKFYLLIWSRWTEIRDIWTVMVDVDSIGNITSRVLERWRPIFVLARFFEDTGLVEGLEQRIIDLANNLVYQEQSRESESNEHTLIRALYDIAQGLGSKKEDWFPYKTIKEHWSSIVKEVNEDETLSIPNWMSSRYLGKMLRKIGFQSKTQQETEGGEVWLKRTGNPSSWHVRVNSEMIDTLILRYGVMVNGDDDKPSQSPLEPFGISGNEPQETVEKSTPEAVSENSENPRIAKSELEGDEKKIRAEGLAMIRDWLGVADDSEYRVGEKNRNTDWFIQLMELEFVLEVNVGSRGFILSEKGKKLHYKLRGDSK